MELLTDRKKPIYVNPISIHKMKLEQAKAFLLYQEAEVERLKKDIVTLENIIRSVERVDNLNNKLTKEGYYMHEVNFICPLWSEKAEYKNIKEVKQK